MGPFVFRAQAALDFRRTRDDEARRELAAANGAVRSAEAELNASVEARAESLERARQAEAEDTGVAARQWHRNWILAQQQEVDRRREVLEQRKVAATAAREHQTRTRIDVRVLEKLQERARRAYDLNERREEQKEIDWLAVLRSIARPGGLEGTE